MRIAILSALVALCFAAPASASTKFNLIFTSHNGSAIHTDDVTAAAGDLLHMEFQFEPDVDISAMGWSVMWDFDLEDELNILGVREWQGYQKVGGLFLPINPGSGTLGGNVFRDSSAFEFGEALTFESVAIGNPLPGGSTYVIGTILMQINDPQTDGDDDIISGAFNLGIDGVFDANGASVPVDNATASVNAVPQPATAVMLGLGLAGLGYLARRR